MDNFKCTCKYLDCEHHPSKHNNSCNPCIDKNLKHGEIPACFWNKLDLYKDNGGSYTFTKFAEKVAEISK